MMILDVLQENLENLIHPLIKENGLFLVELKVLRKGRDVCVEILVDKPLGGISLAECSSVNRKINDTIEEKGIIAENYTIEVSSPGLDRPLTTSNDFQRIIGRCVRIFLSRPVADKIEYEGLILKIEMNNLILDLGQDLGQNRIEIPMETIKTGKQVIEKLNQESRQST